MSYDEYWNMDSTLVIAYRKAERLKQERTNNDFWLQGMYFYEALCDVAPILQPFAKKGTKPRPYPEKPYSLGGGIAVSDTGETAEERKKLLTGKAAFEAWALHYNREFEKKKAEEVKDNA